MTRKEIIEKAAADHRDIVCCGFDDPIADTQEESFIVGAEWADEHPKKGLVSIDKACEWLRKNYTNYMINDLSKYVENVCSFDIFDDLLIDDFYKAMEE